MPDVHDLLPSLAVILCVAAATTVLFQKLRQPVVLGYLLAGMIVGPHLAVPLVADPAIAQVFSELGVILLMFSLGLEFSIRKLVRVGPTSGIVAVIECSAMVWLGYTAGQLFGWSVLQSIFAGAIVAISSTTIIVKAFEEQRVSGKKTELVFGILIIEDLLAILLMAILTAVGTGAGLSAGDVFATVGKLVAFLFGMVVIGLLVIPRAVRYVVSLERAETTLVAAIGICFALALLAQKFGYSVALGAFLAGTLVAESGEGKRIEQLVQPVRDVFGAIFFVAVGMLIDPRLVAEHWGAVLAFAGIVVVGKVAAVSFGSVLAGRPVRDAVRAGMSMSQIGEFSFIIAGVGLSLGVVDEFLYPVAVAVSALTTLLTPFLIRASEPFAAVVDRRMPSRVATFVSLYGSWIARFRQGSAERGAPERRTVVLLAVDFLVLLALVIGGAVALVPASELLRDHLAFGRALSRLSVLCACGVVAAPFVVGAFRLVGTLAGQLAGRAFPASAPGQTDLGHAPRAALRTTIQVAVSVLLCVPLLAVTQPFLPGPTAVVFLIILCLLGFSFWRRTAHLHDHVRAGSEVVFEAIARQSHATDDDAAQGANAQVEVERVLPGFGALVPIRVVEGSGAVGRTLAGLNVRGATGATIFAISRSGAPSFLPGPDEKLQAGDVVLVAGEDEAIAAARELFGDRVEAAVPARLQPIADAG